MKSAIFFAPAILCAAISFQALVIAARADPSWSRSLFYAFLPACFLLMAATFVHMSRDISRLRRRLARLERKAFPDSWPDKPNAPGHPPASETGVHDATFLADSDHPSLGSGAGR